MSAYTENLSNSCHLLCFPSCINMYLSYELLSYGNVFGLCLSVSNYVCLSIFSLSFHIFVLDDLQITDAGLPSLLGLLFLAVIFNQSSSEIKAAKIFIYKENP